METIKNFVIGNATKAISFVKGLGKPTLIKCGIGAALTAAAGVGLHFVLKSDEDEAEEITEQGEEAESSESEAEENVETEE